MFYVWKYATICFHYYQSCREIDFNFTEYLDKTCASSLPFSLFPRLIAYFKETFHQNYFSHLNNHFSHVYNIFFMFLNDVKTNLITPFWIGSHLATQQTPFGCHHFSRRHLLGTKIQEFIYHVFFDDRSSAEITSAEFAWYDLERNEFMCRQSRSGSTTGACSFIFLLWWYQNKHSRLYSMADVNGGNCRRTIDLYSPVIGKHVLLLPLITILHRQQLFEAIHRSLLFCYSFPSSTLPVHSDRRICFIYSHVTQKKSTSIVIFHSAALVSHHCRALK